MREENERTPAEEAAIKAMKIEIELLREKHGISHREMGAMCGFSDARNRQMLDPDDTPFYTRLHCRRLYAACKGKGITFGREVQQVLTLFDTSGNETAVKVSESDDAPPLPEWNNAFVHANSREAQEDAGACDAMSDGVVDNMEAARQRRLRREADAARAAERATFDAAVTSRR